LICDGPKATTGPSLSDQGREAGDPPSPDEVRAQLRRILDSPTFEASERRRHFLRYISDEALAGRADLLKGYAIATAVFERDDGFDPQTDPVVRLEARRLRRALEHYFFSPAVGAMSQAQLGNQAAARAAFDEISTIDPTFAEDPRATFRLHHVPEDVIEEFMDGLRKAGLDDPAA
jgi:hypothetical protein